MKKIIRILSASVSLLLCACLSGCSRTPNSISTLEYRFTPDKTSDYEDINILYINEDISHLTLDGSLKLDSGEVTVQVINVENIKTEWSGTYLESTSFIIELSDIKAGTKLALTIRATQTNKMKLSFFSETKLVNDPKAPPKPEPHKVSS